jgi:hypothetical protein
MTTDISKGPPNWADRDVRETGVQTRSFKFTNADLTTAGLTQAIDLGRALPANAWVLGYSLTLDDAFDSPGAGSLDVQIGDDTNDDDSICSAYDAYTGSANEGVSGSRGTAGIQPSGRPTGTQLSVLFTATTDNLNTFTNGDLDIEVAFVAL